MRFLFYFLAVVSVLANLSCEKGEPVTQESDRLILSVSPSTILNYGDTSIVTAYVTHTDGRNVVDGTRVILQSDGGSIGSEVSTSNGKAEAVFISDAAVGTYTITAQSGQIGADGSITATINVVDRAITVGSLLLTASPSSLTQRGGEINLSAIALDQAGQPIHDLTIVISSSHGSLTSNGATLISNSEGRVTDQLMIQSLGLDVTEVVVIAESSGIQTEKRISISKNEPPMAAFAYSPTNPQIGDQVFFNGQLSSDPDGGIASYLWDFGNGETAIGKEASTTYQNARDFQVTLTVKDQQGSSAAYSEVISIGSNQPPTADFSFSPEFPRAGDIITFDGGLSTDEDGEIVEYEWQMGNGSSRQGRTVNYAFSSGGSYHVSLTVTDQGGKTATTGKTVMVVGNIPPAAVIQINPESPTLGQQVTFNASESIDEDGVIRSYQWNLGNGYSPTNITASTVYNYSGTYIISLTVTDDEGAKGYATQILSISDNQDPTASFSFEPQSPKENEVVTFNAATSSDPDGFISRFSWDFGDGASGNGSVVQHRYQNAGSYLVSLKVTDNHNGTHTIIKDIQVMQGGIPTAKLSLDPSTLQPPGGTVILDASLTSDDEDPVHLLSFDFNSYAPEHVAVTIAPGSSAMRQAVIEDAQNGDRIIFECEARDTDGNLGTTSSVLNITDVSILQAPRASLSIRPSQLTAPGGTIILDASETTDQDNDLSELYFSYAFQATGTAQVVLTGGNGSLQNAVISSASADDLVIFLLTVEDPTGLQDTETEVLTMVADQSNDPPSAHLSSTPFGSYYLPSNPQTPTEIILDARLTTDTEDSLNSLAFDFSWATSDTLAQVTIDTATQEHGVAKALVYQATAGQFIRFFVTVTDSGGLIDTATLDCTAVMP